MPPLSTVKNRLQKKTVLEKTLLAVVVGLGISAIVLLAILLIPKRNGEPVIPNACRTTRCINAATKVLESVDQEVDPCDDFYAFACGNLLKKHHHDASHPPSYQMQEKRKHQLLKIYSEKMENEDHKMVWVAKNLFRKCLNEEEIERDNLRTIKDVLRQAGGWPVMDGRSWDETRFDWLNATYKLRQLGYPYKIFLSLNVKPDDGNCVKYRLMVEWTQHEGYKSELKDSINVDKMVEVATIFGAPDFRNNIYKEMKAAYKFGQQLMDGYKKYDTRTENMTVESFQRTVKQNIDWLSFINTITGPKVVIAKDEHVIFQTPNNLDTWFDVLRTTAKRTIANYMMWKVIEQQIPYLTKNLNILVRYDKESETRAEFCLKEVEKRFVLSPMEVMYCRKYISNNTKLEIEEVMMNNKNEFVRMINSIKWLGNLDKGMIIEMAKKLKFVIGQNGSCYDDNLLNELDVDMIKMKSHSFLNLLSQVTRNHETAIYSKIKRLTNADFYEFWHPPNSPGHMKYSALDNVIYVPVEATQDFIFQHGKPNYLNYRGLTGEVFLDLIMKNANALSKETKDNIAVLQKCVENQQMLLQSRAEHFELTPVLYKIFGDHISYEAYATWEKIHEKELPLVYLGYSWQQLFWIRSSFCQTGNFSMGDFYVKPEFVSDIDFIVRRNNPNFAKDFGCQVGSRMNPVENCRIL